jgi:hypothetical protein
VNRGSYTTKEIVQACKKNEVAHASPPAVCSEKV